MKGMILRMLTRFRALRRRRVDVIDDPIALAEYLDFVAEGYRS